jgi:hypothetical protein
MIFMLISNIPLNHQYIFCITEIRLYGITGFISAANYNILPDMVFLLKGIMLVGAIVKQLFC